MSEGDRFHVQTGEESSRTTKTKELMNTHRDWRGEDPRQSGPGWRSGGGRGFEKRYEICPRGRIGLQKAGRSANPKEEEDKFLTIGSGDPMIHSRRNTQKRKGKKERQEIF